MKILRILLITAVILLSVSSVQATTVVFMNFNGDESFPSLTFQKNTAGLLPFTGKPFDLIDNQKDVVEAEILTLVREDYALYDIVFTTDKNLAHDYTWGIDDTAYVFNPVGGCPKNKCPPWPDIDLSKPCPAGYKCDRLFGKVGRGTIDQWGNSIYYPTYTRTWSGSFALGAGTASPSQPPLSNPTTPTDLKFDRIEKALANSAAHEIGHLFGLKDPDENNLPQKMVNGEYTEHGWNIMYVETESMEINNKEFTSSDKETLLNFLGSAAPTVLSIDPHTAVAGTTVHITNLEGTGFYGDMNLPTVKLVASCPSYPCELRQIHATNVNVVSPTQITCYFYIPSDNSGLFDVLVTKPNGFTGYLLDAFEVTPAMKLQKSVSPGLIVLGKPVTYTYVVTNTGFQPIKNVVVTDSEPDVIPQLQTPAGDMVLDPGESWTYTALSSPSEDVTSTARAKGVDTLGIEFGAVSGPVTVTVNQLPVAYPGSDQTVNVYSAVSLDGSLSFDPDNDPITYRWSILTRPAGSTAILSDTTAQKPAFTADKIGDFTIQLIVNDGFIDGIPSTITLHATKIAVPVDIEPGACPNKIALNFKGPLLFVAIPGTENLDVQKIDPATITLSREGFNGTAVKPLSNTLVIIPYLVTSSCSCQNSLRDYTQDLVLVFDFEEVITKLQLQEVVGETVPFTVQGTLKAEYGTTPIIGSDCMKVLSEYYLHLFFVAKCPVDLKITDPDGLEMSKISYEIPSAQYIEADINDDGSPDDLIFIGERKIGDYAVQVIPDFDANPTDTYSLTAGSGQSEVILAYNMAIDAIPDTPYTIQLSQDGEITVPAKVRIVPKSLNIASKGKFVAFITLPSNYKVIDVDPKSVECEGAPALRLMRNKWFPQTFAAVFSREKLVNVKPGDRVQLTITGTINKNGQNVGFLGSDVIKVTRTKGNIKEAIDDVEKMTDENVFSHFNPQ